MTGKCECCGKRKGDAWYYDDVTSAELWLCIFCKVELNKSGVMDLTICTTN